MSTRGAITESALHERAGESSFRRGCAYFDEGKVEQLHLMGPKVEASVNGTIDYPVTLHVLDHIEFVHYRCWCPVGSRGKFCKHCVAVALAWNDAVHAIDPDGQRDPLTIVDRPVPVTVPAHRHAATLREWPELPLSTDVSIDAVRKALTAAFRARGFIEYRRMRAFVAGIDQALDVLENFLSRDTASNTIKLSEQTLRRVERVFERCDDSGGLLRGVSDRVGAIHLRACLDARPDPVKLAEKLFAWETTSDWETFLDAVVTYRDVLGDEGVARYRALATSAWSSLSPSVDSELDGLALRTLYVTRIVQQLALESGDPAEVASSFERDLDSPYGYIRLAQQFERLRRNDLALYWALQGADRFAIDEDKRLQTYLAGLEAANGNNDTAVDWSWKAFEVIPGEHTYRDLHVFATIAGRWPDLRERALALLEANPHPRHPGHSVLVDVLLWERSAAEALDAAARTGAGHSQIMTLAEVCERDHPADASRLYMSQIDELIGATSRQAYVRTAAVLSRAKALALEADTVDEFEAELDDVRRRHGRKSSFMPMIADL